MLARTVVMLITKEFALFTEVFAPILLLQRIMPASTIVTKNLMAKKSSSSKIPTDFGKGLVLGIVLTLVVLLVYFRFFALKNPPSNGCEPIFISGFGVQWSCH
jgi:hypothetical protein